MCFVLFSEPEFLNVYGAQESSPQESIPPASVAWRAGTITLFVVTLARPHRLA